MSGENYANIFDQVSNEFKAAALTKRQLFIAISDKKTLVAQETARLAQVNQKIVATLLENPQAKIELKERNEIISKIRGLETEISMENDKLTKMDEDVKKFSNEYSTKLRLLSTGLSEHPEQNHTAAIQPRISERQKRASTSNENAPGNLAKQSKFETSSLDRRTALKVYNFKFLEQEVNIYASIKDIMKEVLQPKLTVNFRSQYQRNGSSSLYNYFKCQTCLEKFRADNIPSGDNKCILTIKSKYEGKLCRCDGFIKKK